MNSNYMYYLLQECVFKWSKSTWVHVSATWGQRSIHSSLKAYFKPRLTNTFVPFWRSAWTFPRRFQVRVKSVPVGFRYSKLEQWGSLSLLLGPRPWKEALWVADCVSEIDSTFWKLYLRLALAPFSAKCLGLTHWTPSVHTCWNLALLAWDSVLPQTPKRRAWKVYLKVFCMHVKLWILNNTVWFHTSKNLNKFKFSGIIFPIQNPQCWMNSGQMQTMNVSNDFLHIGDISCLKVLNCSRT